MDKVKVDDTFDQAGDKYAKRLLDRSQYSDCYSQSYRRRRSVLKALNKNSMNLSSNPHYDGNPFEKEFSKVNKAAASVDENDDDAKDDDDQLEMTYVSTWPEDNTDLSSRTYDVEPSQDSLFGVESLGDGAAGASTSSCAPTDYPSSDQFRTDIADTDVESIDDFANLRPSDRYDPTLLVGERFGPLTPIEWAMQNTLNQKYDREFKQCNAELQLQGPDEYFGTHVIEICEPTIIEFHRKSCDCESVGTITQEADLTYVAGNVDEASACTPTQTSKAELTYTKQNDDKERKETDMDSLCTSLSFGSENMRDIDLEIDKMQLEHDAPACPPTKTSAVPEIPGAIRSHDVGDEQHVESTAINMNIPPGGPSNESPTMNFKAYQKPASPLAVDHHNTSKQRSMSKTASFIKRHTSFLFKNVRTPKLVRRKSSVESARKTPSKANGNQWPQVSGNNALMRSNTVGSSDADRASNRFMQQVQQVQDDLPPHIDDTMASEMENFVKVALGSGKYNSTMANPNFDSDNQNYSILSHDEPDSGRTNSRTMREPKSEPPKHSGTLNRTLSMYRTLTQKIRDKFRRYEHADSTPSPLTLYQSHDAPDHLTPEMRGFLRELQQKIAVQDTVIYQTSKALQLCDSMREFTVSPERVEYERILLIASLTKKAILREIDRLTNDESYNNHGTYAYTERGEVTLKDIRLQLRRDMLLRERQNGDVIEWFIVVVLQGVTVWATQPIACSISNSQIYFPGEHLISGLTPDFRLSIKVYSIRLQQVQLFNHDEKYHIPRCQSFGSSSKMKTPKMLRRNKSVSPKQYKVKFAGIRETSFAFCGSVDLMLYDLKLPSPWPLNSLISNTVLQGTIDIKLSCNLELTIFHAGFLTHCEESGDLAWNRRWCLLEGHTLLFWNYPREQEFNPPMYIIDLVNCVSSRVDPVDRKLCPRPRTLLLETKNNTHERQNIIVDSRSHGPVHRHLLSCDNNEELFEWHSKLNHVVSALSDWNIIHAS